MGVAGLNMGWVGANVYLLFMTRASELHSEENVVVNQIYYLRKGSLAFFSGGICWKRERGWGGGEEANFKPEGGQGRQEEGAKRKEGRWGCWASCSLHDSRRGRMSEGASLMTFWSATRGKVMWTRGQAAPCSRSGLTVVNGKKGDRGRGEGWGWPHFFVLYTRGG